MLKGETGVHVSGCIRNLNCCQKQELENDTRFTVHFTYSRAWTNFYFIQEMVQGGLF